MFISNRAGEATTGVAGILKQDGNGRPVLRMPEWGPAAYTEEDRQLQSFHFVGIGGYGMSGLALVLANLGYQVTGSDMKESDRTSRLVKMGISIKIGHDATNMGGAGAVVYSTDVPDDNVELVEARRRRIPLYHRSELLAMLLNDRHGIAVTGTHGKTTTSSMIALVLEKGGLDPTVLIGGELDEFNGNAKLGASQYLVAEACESDGSFLRYRPAIAVVTNIDKEHLDHYGGDFDRVKAAFRGFLAGTKPGGLVVFCADDPLLSGMVPQDARQVSYGFARHARLRPDQLCPNGRGYDFDLLLDGSRLGRVGTSIPGKHNVVNALAAAAVGLELDIPVEVMGDVVRSFNGVKRRFQVLARRADGLTVVDDYAHHPTEIKATLKAAREQTAGRIIAVFQPQRYSRTQILMEEFSQAFGEADEVILTEIYSPPGERPIVGVNSQVLAKLIRDRESKDVQVLTAGTELEEVLWNLAGPGDTVLTMGAGDIWKVAHRLAARLENNKNSQVS